MEMKKSYSPFGSTPLSVDEVLPDIQTGRAVYPDKDKEADASYMERINQYKHEGFHDVSEDSGSSGGGDFGYSCSEGWVTLTDESVTTTIVDDNSFADCELVYSGRITADTIKVTFNGTEYTVPVFVDTTPHGTVYLYGAQYSVESGNYDFSTYPFSIVSSSVDNSFHTETASTYQVKIEALEETIETSECFKKAVRSVGGDSSSGGGSEPLVVNISNRTFDKTAHEICDAFYNQQTVFIKTSEGDEASLLLSHDSNERTGLQSFYFTRHGQFVCYASLYDDYPVDTADAD